jgi:hypothetical protein
MANTKIDAGAVVDKIEAGKEVTPAEQRAYDKAMQDAADEQGYETVTWSGRVGYRPIGGGDLFFDSERDVQAHVMRSRVHANLTGGIGA